MTGREDPRRQLAFPCLGLSRPGACVCRDVICFAFDVLDSGALAGIMSDASNMISRTPVSYIQKHFFPSSKFSVNGSSPVFQGDAYPWLF